MNIEGIITAHELCVETNGKEGERANLPGMDLSGIDLSGRNLKGANLTGARLDGANLTGANIERASLKRVKLSGARLDGANLTKAYLGFATLTNASLTNANLSGVDLWFCKGDGIRIKRVFYSGHYTVNYTADLIQIGCENHSIEEWKDFIDEEIEEMDEDALEFWEEYRDIIFSTVEKEPAE
jgi:hypothetical protein